MHPCIAKLRGSLVFKSHYHNITVRGPCDNSLWLHEKSDGYGHRLISSFLATVKMSFALSVLLKNESRRPHIEFSQGWYFVVIAATSHNHAECLRMKSLYLIYR